MNAIVNAMKNAIMYEDIVIMNVNVIVNVTMNT